MKDEKNSELFEKCQNLAEKKDNVIFGGRIRMYQYFNMRQIIDEALKACPDSGTVLEFALKKPR